MGWEFIMPMVVSVVFILTVGGVILLRPISRRLADLLEAMAAERRDPALKEELMRLREINESLSERLALLEEKQEFTEALLENAERPKLQMGDSRP
jgi:hypothetical protein